METPKMTPKQQKKALSNRKKPLVTIKNVLCSPFDSETRWPVPSADETNRIMRIFDSIPSIDTVVLPHWTELKKIPKAERPRRPKHPLKKHFICGIGELTRTLQKKNCTALLIEANIDPRILVKHLVNMAVNQNIPLLCIPNLKSIIKKTFQFNSACIGLGKNSDHTVTKQLLDTMLDISKNNSTNGNSLSTLDITDDKMDDDKLADDTTPVKKFEYLLRVDPNRRVFIPENYEAKRNSKRTDFVKVKEVKGIDSTAFKSMVLKRYHSNPDRPKKKYKKSNFPNETNINSKHFIKR